jgi:hypothetical protein
MSAEAFAKSSNSTSGAFVPLWQRLGVFLAAWLVAALVIASCVEMQLEPGEDRLAEGIRAFYIAPLLAALGLDFAVTGSRFPSEAAVYAFLGVFISQGIIMLLCRRRVNFAISVGALLVLLLACIFYTLRLFHYLATTGHG